MEFEKIIQIVNGSKQYEFNGPVLTITGYYTGDKVNLDLSKLTEEILEELAPDEEEYDDYDDDVI